MAKQQQPKDLALGILDAMLRDGTLRPGDDLKGIVLQERFGLNRPREDFKAGIDYALQQGWIQMGQHATVKMTSVGFAAGGCVIPGDEELAREVLKVMKELGCRAGGNGVAAMPLKLRFGADRSGDFEAGVEFAMQKGWIEVNQKSGYVMFTESGYNEA